LPNATGLLKRRDLYSRACYAVVFAAGVLCFYYCAEDMSESSGEVEGAVSVDWFAFRTAAYSRRCTGIRPISKNPGLNETGVSVLGAWR